MWLLKLSHQYLCVTVWQVLKVTWLWKCYDKNDLVMWMARCDPYFMLMCVITGHDVWKGFLPTPLWQQFEGLSEVSRHVIIMTNTVGGCLLFFDTFLIFIFFLFSFFGVQLGIIPSTCYHGFVSMRGLTEYCRVNGVGRPGRWQAMHHAVWCHDDKVTNMTRNEGKVGK